MAIKKAKSDVKQRMEEQQRQALYVDDEAQNRLAEILSDAPTIEKLAGTEWEMRPLRFGTQYLIVNEVCKLKKLEHDTYENVIIELANTIPVVAKVITFALLNDKDLIYKDGHTSDGFSETFQRTFDTVLWNAEREDLSKIMLDCLMMVDVSFFMEALGMLQIFRASVTEKKRMRKKTAEQR